jgi:hypothetical protein
VRTLRHLDWCGVTLTKGTLPSIVSPFVVKQYRWVYMNGIGKVERGFTILTAKTFEDAVHGADTWLTQQVSNAHHT